MTESIRVAARAPTLTHILALCSSRSKTKTSVSNKPSHVHRDIRVSSPSQVASYTIAVALAYIAPFPHSPSQLSVLYFLSTTIYPLRSIRNASRNSHRPAGTMRQPKCGFHRYMPPPGLYLTQGLKWVRSIGSGCALNMASIKREYSKNGLRREATVKMSSFTKQMMNIIFQDLYSWIWNLE